MKTNNKQQTTNNKKNLLNYLILSLLFNLTFIYKSNAQGTYGTYGELTVSNCYQKCLRGEFSTGDLNFINSQGGRKLEIEYSNYLELKGIDIYNGNGNVWTFSTSLNNISQSVYVFKGTYESPNIFNQVKIVPVYKDFDPNDPGAPRPISPVIINFVTPEINLTTKHYNLNTNSWEEDDCILWGSNFNYTTNLSCLCKPLKFNLKFPTNVTNNYGLGNNWTKYDITSFDIPEKSNFCDIPPGTGIVGARCFNLILIYVLEPCPFKEETDCTDLEIEKNITICCECEPFQGND